MTKRGHNFQPIAPLAQVLVLQHPGMRMRHQHRVQPRLERRINVRLRRIPNHPSLPWNEAAFNDKSLISRSIFFFHNRRVRKIPAQPRPVDLQPLLLRMPLRE